MQLSDLIKQLKSYESSGNIAQIKKAYAFAERAHAEEKRVTGEPFIQHPLGVAYILTELKLDKTTIIAALLHDVAEDTTVSLKEIQNNFGPEVATLVDGVTRFQSLKDLPREDYHAERIRKVILASAKDIRVIFIKLADLLHNMQTLYIHKEEKRRDIARDALEIYAPIAHKLGIASIKWKLEDLAFMYLEPETYKDLQHKIIQTQKERERELKKIQHHLDEELKKTKIPYELIGRPKHVYSIYRKMQKKNQSFEELYDLIALRVITDTVRHCYELLGIIHNMWTPVPKEFDDYIATPKSNMYQSLHTVVIGPAQKPLEIQIRTQEMHEIAEQGIAAHWKYKGISESEADQKLKWMMEINELQKGSENAREFLKMLHINFFEDEIFTFTPKGKVLELPKDATVLDFAYAVHSDLGNRCIAAKVNHQFVPLRSALKNGDMVEIITSKTQHPSRDWLKIIKTSKAAAKIKQYLRTTQEIPVKSFRKGDEERKELEEQIIHVEGIPKPHIQFSKCCRPLPGEKIIGVRRTVNRVAIHRADCPTVEKAKKDIKNKKVTAHWLDTIGKLVDVRVDATNRTGLFAEILNTLIATNAQMKSAHAKPIGEQFVECSFSMETQGLAHLQDIILRIKKINGVRHVFIGNIAS